MKRWTATIILAGAVLGATVAPAGAHEEIAPTSVPVGRAAFITLSAANEEQVPLTGLVLTAPEGATFGGGVRVPAGWKATAEDHQVSWEGGALEPGHFDEWGVELEAVDQPGTIAFMVTLRFADGTSEDAQVPLEVTAGSTPAEPPVASTPPTTAATGAQTPTSLAPATTTDSGDDGQASLALGLAIAAAVVALGALVVALRRPRAAGSKPAESAEQKW